MRTRNCGLLYDSIVVDFFCGETISRTSNRKIGTFSAQVVLLRKSAFPTLLNILSLKIVF